jgi:isopentenyldiphosphate isomerase
VELMTVYDAQKQPTTKTMVRDTPMPKEGYRFVVTVLLFNEAGELLIQKRQGTKTSWPNYWDYTAGGAVQVGELCYQAAERELAEELGIRLSLKNTPSRLTVRFAEGWNEIYFVQWSGEISEIHLQQEEVAAVQWVNEAQYITLVNQKQFIPYLYANTIFALNTYSSEQFPS